MSAGLLRAVWLVTAAAVAGAALAAIVTVLRGEVLGEDDAKTIFSLVAVSLCGGAAVAALHLLERAGLRLLGAVLLIAAAVDLLLLELGIWKSVLFDSVSSDYLKLIPTGFAWAIAIIVLATLPLVPTSPAVRRTVVPAVAACALVGATMATVMVWRDLDSAGWAKTLAVIAILMVAGYLLTPLVERFTRRQTVNV